MNLIVKANALGRRILFASTQAVGLEVGSAEETFVVEAEDSSSVPGPFNHRLW